MNDTYVLSRIIDLANIKEINDDTAAYRAFDQISVWADSLRKLKQDPRSASITHHWYPIIALPPHREMVLIQGRSYNTENPTFLISGFHDADWRPLDPWRMSNGDSLSDLGWEPTKWTPISTDLLDTQTREELHA